MDDQHSDSLFAGALLMFGSYFVAGFIPILPVLFLPFPVSVYASVGCAFLGLFILGYMKGKVVRIPPIRSGLEMLFIGGIATILGVFVGTLFRTM